MLINPYLPLKYYIPDGEPRVFDNKLYIYGSCDLYNGDNYCLGEYNVCYADINDLENFKVVKSYTFKDSLISFEEGGQFQAPDCVKYKDKYYLFYNRMKKMECEVAVSNTPIGPFKFYGVIHYKDGKIPNDKLFDPAVLIDDDRIYLYTGFCPNKNSRFAHLARKYSQVYELEEDMLTIKKDATNLIPGPLKALGTSFENHAFFEASSIRKINGKYYFVYSSENSHDLCYAVSSYPNKDFIYKGILISNCNIGYNGNQIPEMPYGNTHGSIEYINGNYYVFYHRQTTGKETSRQACAEILKMDNDGNFMQAEMTTQGLNGKPLNDIFDLNATCCSYLVSDKENIKLGVINDIKNEYPTLREDINDSNIHFIDNLNNAVVGYKYFNFCDANYIILNIDGKSGFVNIKNDLNGKVLKTFLITKDKKVYEGNIDFIKGVKPLYIEFKDAKGTKFYNLKTMKK